jgi:uncharacterized protein
MKELLLYAENALVAIVTSTPLPPLPELDVLDREYGAFCTLKIRGNLRGCIGNFAGTAPLREVLPRVIRESALDDPRFPPVTPRELPDISVSLSILFYSEPVGSATAIQPGRDGVILKVGRRRAVFLPEVATEQGWDRETLLEGLCRKGGLPPASWKREDARLETFRTLRIFRDPVDPEVIRIEGGES